eukprot:COSAG04_NODE_2162_length_4649_cov_8.389231_3_plen_132_part_00
MSGIEVRWTVKAPSGDHAHSVAEDFRARNCGGPGSDLNDGHFDYSRCADDPTFRQCHSKACMGADWGQAHADGKGRRLEQADEENEELRAKLAAAEALLAQKDASIATKDAVIAAKDELLAKKDEQLEHCA